MDRNYWIRESYQHASSTQYYPDTPTTTTYQPDVYLIASRLAQALGCRRVIDVGCGHGRKLAKLKPNFDIVGVDYGGNISHCRREYNFGTWLEHNLNENDILPIKQELYAGSVLICSDVIEHVSKPEVLLGKLKFALEAGASALLLSTPEREITRGQLDQGPPKNRAHVREWNIREFDTMLLESGFPIKSTGLTRSNDSTSALATILSVICTSTENLRICRHCVIEYLPGDCTPKPKPFRERLHFAARMLIRGR